MNISFRFFKYLLFLVSNDKSILLRTNIHKLKLKNLVDISFMTTHAFFFISNTFISNTRLKLSKNQAKAKQHREGELLLFENFAICYFLHQCYHLKLI